LILLRQVDKRFKKSLKNIHRVCGPSLKG